MRNRSLFAVLGLIVVLLIITNLQFPFTARIRYFIREGLLPFSLVSSRVQESLWVLANRAKSYKSIQEENTELRKELGELSARVTEIGELERENREFRRMLDFEKRSELKLISAKVISRDPSNWWNTVWVDRGKADGITRDMAVLTLEGLVGKTLEVEEHSAEVLLIVDENCKVSGWIQDGRQPGIVQGNILAGGKESQCRMTFIDRLSKIKHNDRVYTSGLGGIFPRGILIGTISTLGSNPESDQSTLYKQANVIPAVDLARIDEVFIKVGVKPTLEAVPKKSKK